MSESMIEKIKNGKGYWYVRIRPVDEFYKKNLFDMTQLREIINSTQVRYRGWYYPHIQKPAVIGEGVLGDSVSFEGFLEHWNLYRSGQFEHYFAMREDFTVSPEKLEKIKSSFPFNKDDSKSVEKLLEIVSTIYRMTEIYLFATNLAQNIHFRSITKFEITIELKGVKDRMLFVWEWGRELWSPYICHRIDDTIRFQDEYKKDDLILNSKIIALDQVKEIFENFNWEKPNTDSISTDQDKFLQGRY